MVARKVHHPTPIMAFTRLVDGGARATNGRPYGMDITFFDGSLPVCGRYVSAGACPPESLSLLERWHPEGVTERVFPWR